MKHYTKFNLAEHPTEIPTVGLQIVETQCYHCGRPTRIPVPNAYIDWEKIAAQYRSGYEDMVTRFGRIIADIDVMQTGTNPVREYLANEWRVLIDDIKGRFS